MRKTFLTALLLASATAFGAVPQWFETDSASAVRARIARDFPYEISKSKELFPDYSQKQIDRMIADKTIETLEIDGKRYIHRKAVRNVPLLLEGKQKGWVRGAQSKESRRQMLKEILAQSKGDGSLSNLQEVKVRFTVKVPYNDLMKGDTLRVWLPFPLQTVRQPKVTLDAVSDNMIALSTQGRSVHNTLFGKAPVVEGDTAVFSYDATFIVGAQYFSPDYIRKNIKPYDKDSELYKHYTAFESPNIVDLSGLAKKIVGNETDPYKCSEMVYDYIVRHYPWAGAREYSTIPCIPTYVIEQGHGDCGQVSLLYISLMRSLGIPARWESGWMLHPGEKNLHDWAEVYFEGIGWVPVDTSFGRYLNADTEAAQKYFSTGQDQWRMATNLGVNSPFYPAKKYLRSETVDSQMGEVETSKANLFYPGWDQTLEILSVTPIK